MTTFKYLNRGRLLVLYSQFQLLLKLCVAFHFNYCKKEEIRARCPFSKTGKLPLWLKNWEKNIYILVAHKCHCFMAKHWSSSKQFIGKYCLSVECTPKYA